MELATAALGSLLPKLGTLLSDAYRLQKGVRGEIRFLQVEMESMQAVLHMLSKLPPQQLTDLDKIWSRDLKELSYDIEDSVDTFMVQIGSPLSAKPHSFERFFEKTIRLLTKAKTRHHIANDIEDIKRRIREVSERRERYNKIQATAASHADTSSVDPRVLASFEHASRLVGTHVHVENISKLLAQENSAHKEKTMVLAIPGVGGLGKTTIANLVYERLGGQFDCRAFVSVSLKPNMKQILKSILRQVGKGDSGEEEPGELIRSIRQFLEDKRYFIVIDDLWSQEAWKTMECVLVDNRLGNRVIVTTRKVDVAKLSSDDGVMYELGPLSEEDSKKLLSKRIFNEGEGIPSELEEVTMNILKKCGGIPLAIITIASVLASKPNRTQFDWHRVYNSMGSGLQEDKSLQNMREILHLSYDDLPPYLKPCLLYMSMFPEDTQIGKLELTRLWVAEGFTDDGEGGSNLYELADRYFDELVNRSMIQPVGIDVSGTAHGCRVHDMILDLIISISAQENFATIKEGLDLMSVESRIRRLSLQENIVDSHGENRMEETVTLLPTTAIVARVRTIIALDGVHIEYIPPLAQFSVLRVLVLQYVSKENLKGLWSLHLLRYLELQGSDIKTEHLVEIGNLKHLKTLDLWGTNITELPAGILQLRQLENLITTSNVRFPGGIGDIVSLQRLAALNATRSPHTLAELGNLSGLRILIVTGLFSEDETCVKTFSRSLSNLHNIHTLNISCAGDIHCSLDCIPDHWRGPVQLQRFEGCLFKVPQWFSSLSVLSTLVINVNRLGQDDIHLLGALPMLRTLKLTVRPVDDITEEQMVIGSNHSFRALTYFEFRPLMPCGLVFAQGVMKKLQRLVLRFHVKGIVHGGFHVGLENLTSLKLVTVTFDCKDASITEVEDAAAKCRSTINVHPNNPTLEMSRVNDSHLGRPGFHLCSQDS